MLYYKYTICTIYYTLIYNIISLSFNHRTSDKGFVRVFPHPFTHKVQPFIGG